MKQNFIHDNLQNAGFIGKGAVMRVAIVGSRSIEYDRLKDKAYELLCRYIPANATEIVSGGAVGIDTLADTAEKRRFCATTKSLHMHSTCWRFGTEAPTAPLIPSPPVSRKAYRSKSSPYKSGKNIYFTKNS